MKPAWDQLMEEFDEKPEAGVLVADVDCVGTGQSLCERHGIKSFPTIGYGDPENDLEWYSGARTYDALADFAKELKPPTPKTGMDLAMHKLWKATKPIIKPLKEDVEHIVNLRKNAAVLLVIAGVILGMLTNRLVCPRVVVKAAKTE
mmetsp:Transcript_15253/g.24247  ORF Transcript_15253/g.24247 Transcript_15253/m.24247 type:complete len:147 (+) Transcript_15253:215-655(+)|eukprot:CAMPEP_0169129032 /NCGR_PEP_ID=MMETSP1015-20121227/36903_1 /TAXON_ID=342587 /ORGANISM="Karlodinium micrum, Strain CCMP2283" /LENGTH=146 /DNA_ID=CAMNT_0009193011 /DNA_START=207 /DNA_END=647 /DNA_ORIENTATION=+